MIDYKIAIPTYQRYDIAKNKTIAFLAKHNIPKERIYIFVANEEEKKEYGKTLPDYQIVVAVPGIGPVRNFIEQTWSNEGDYIISMDDDTTDIKIKTEDDKLVSIDDFYEEVILRGWEEMQKYNAKHWGLYPVQNALFMKRKIRTGLTFICSNLYGLIVQKTDELKRIAITRADYEYSIRQFLYNGSVVRFDYLVATTQYVSKGGLEEYRKNKEKWEGDIDVVINLFPKYAKKKYRKDGTPEIRLAVPKKKKPIIERDIERPWIKL